MKAPNLSTAKPRVASDLGALERVCMSVLRYPRFKALHAVIRDCQDLSQIAREPRCLALEGVTGAGKSTLVQDYAALFARHEQRNQSGVDCLVIPVLYVETPAPVTVKGMAAAMLQALGDPAANRGTLWSMNARLIHFIRECQVELIILDDFQHLIDSETTRVLSRVADWLKVLIKQTRIPFVVVGLEGEVRKVLDANVQLSRLFRRELLAAFKWNPKDADTAREFDQLLKCVERIIELPVDTSLPRAVLLQRIHYATDGVIGHVMTLLGHAALLADRRQTGKIDLPALAQAYAELLAQHFPKKINPFASDGQGVVNS